MAAGLAAAPLLAPAQRAFRVGILGDGTKDENAVYWSVTLDRLRELGYAEGRNLVIESRWGEGKPARLPGLAMDLVATRPDVIVERAFAQIRVASVDGLIVAAILVRHREQLARLAVQHRLPAIYVFPEHLDAGGFIAFGPDLRSLYRRTADNVHRILQDAKPRDMPVEQARVVLGVNLKAARAIGVTIPQSLLVRADRVIE